MRRLPFFAVLVSSLLAGAAVAGAADKSKPAKPGPAKKADEPKKQTSFDSPKAKLHFAVPPAWTHLESTGLPPDQLFMFDPRPAVEAKRKNPPPVTPEFKLMVMPPCSGKADFDTYVDTCRKGLVPGGVTYVEDKATTVGGLPAWTFVYPATATAKVIETKNGVKTPVDKTVKEWHRTTVMLHNDMAVELYVRTDPTESAKYDKANTTLLATFKFE